ncbi:MAG: protease pro-enzyme activation domain-containing protein [Limisphaerales bacterium]
MHQKTVSIRWTIFAVFGGLLLSSPAFSQTVGKQVVPDSVPPAIGDDHLKPLRDLPPTNHLNLAIALPLRNQAELDQLLQEISDPSSPNYRHYLTPQEFTEKFGPTQSNYDAVINFAKASGLTVTQTYSNRALVDVSGDTATVEKALHVKLHVYRHPTENRDFFAPDTEPSVDLDVPILHISGLNNFNLPKPASIKKNNFSGVSPAGGSGPGGLLLGADFRNAYAPGVTLNGAGQIVGLFELDGYYSNDITLYEQQAGLPAVTLTNVLVDGCNGAAGPDNTEIALDIEMAISMAPGLSQVVVYEEGNGGNVADLLNRIASDNLAKQISSSWLIGDNSTYDTAYKQMAAQGQSFFQASGDDGAYYSGIPQWADDVNIITVGGTTLSMNGTGNSYTSETVWNWFNTGEGSAAGGGGVSFNNVSLPSWQSAISMGANKGSTRRRDVPDVAMNADNVSIRADDGQQEAVGGTSAAAPLWAAFTALANQRAAIFGHSTMGFLNPTIYSIGKGAGYATNFNDIVSGNNETPNVPNKYPAVAGYDLCTGWGTPRGPSLLDTLVPGDALTVTPLGAFDTAGPWGGSFNPSTETFSVTNSSAASIDWSLAATSAWLNVSSTGGTLAAGGSANVIVNINPAANSLPVGNYAANVQFSNSNSRVVQTLPLVLTVTDPLVIQPPGSFSVNGSTGGPFTLAAENFSLSNAANSSLNWADGSTSPWLDLSSSGALSEGDTTNVAAIVDPIVATFAPGIYPATVSFTNQTLGTVQSWQFLLLVGQSIAPNGGFETGDFTDWMLNGDGSDYNFVDNSVNVPFIAPHSGTYFAALGEAGFVAYLSQNVSTVAGQSYLLSLWMNSPNYSPGTPNEFSVIWNGNTLFDQVNIPPITTPASGWTNLQFIVNAANPTSLLQIGGRDDNAYLGLDDVTLTPIPPLTLQTSTSIVTNNMAFSWNALTGLVYQVQFATNLLAPGWTPLQTIPATSTPVEFTDTNSVGAYPQKFYQLLLLP